MLALAVVSGVALLVGLATGIVLTGRTHVHMLRSEPEVFVRALVRSVGKERLKRMVRLAVPL